MLDTDEYDSEALEEDDKVLESGEEIDSVRKSAAPEVLSDDVD